MLKYTLLTLTTVVFTACGGGGGGSDSANVSGPTTEVAIEVAIINCTGNTISTYTPLLGGDVIVKIDTNTVINTYHDVNDNRLICVDTGSAKIVRNLIRGNQEI